MSLRGAERFLEVSSTGLRAGGIFYQINQLILTGRDAGPTDFVEIRPLENIKTFENHYSYASESSVVGWKL